MKIVPCREPRAGLSHLQLGPCTTLTYDNLDKTMGILRSDGKMTSFVMKILVLLFVVELSYAQIPCFPGAVGFGTTTKGGRGGKIVFVTNTNASGEGSLRAALEMEGPRIVVFKVGGTIELNGNLMIRNPFITIAGQTAPGGGICIKNGMIAVKTHDVVIRGLRIRQGDLPDGVKPDIRDPIEVWAHKKFLGEVYNVVIDHNSLSWAVDVGLDIGGTAHDITASWNIISEGLNNSIHPKGKHSKGLAFHKTAGTNLTAHHNLLAHNDQRNPKIANEGKAEFVNNVIYDFGLVGTDIGGNLQAHILGNYYKPGPSTQPRKGSIKPFEIDDKALAGAPDLKILISGNVFEGTSTSDEWSLMRGDRRYETKEPAFSSSGLAASTAQEAYDKTLTHAGAIVPERDTVDRRIVNDVRTGSGKVIDSQKEVGGWPVLAAGVAPPDGDSDGMPDEWEKTNGFRPDEHDASEDGDSDGYTNIEEYINGLFPPLSESIGQGKKDQ